METFFNIIWHFPFFGLFFALLYAIVGVFLCCTVVLLPIGKGWIQFARYLLTPFSTRMVSRSDLAKLQKDDSYKSSVYSMEIRLLYFPFGLFAAFLVIFMTLGEFLSIIGIPCGLVWGRSISTVFNPTNKVCVPKAVADEIERMKSTATVEKYTA